MTKKQAERDFLDASIAVWREIDRIMTLGPYPGIHMASDLRISEKLAWERYRKFLDEEAKHEAEEEIFDASLPRMSDREIARKRGNQP